MKWMLIVHQHRIYDVYVCGFLRLCTKPYVCWEFSFGTFNPLRFITYRLRRALR